MRYNVLARGKTLVNKDPKSRCYNGAYFDASYEWDNHWIVLHLNITEDKANGALKFWRDLNDYAVSGRGESARKEFKSELVTEAQIELETMLSNKEREIDYFKAKVQKLELELLKLNSRRIK